MNDQEAHKLAERFWRISHEREHFPRSLETAILWRLPIAIIKLPILKVENINEWLRRRSITLNIKVPDRYVRACLFANAGKGVMFLQGDDSDNELRFSLAHEVAHFLLDYHWVREQAIAVLGEGVRDVLDGRRLPTASEQLNSIIQNIKLGTFTHMMERSVNGSIIHSRTLIAEDRADRLAIELLAPKSNIMLMARNHNIDWNDPASYQTVIKILVDAFGLPQTIATAYGHVIVLKQKRPRSFREWIGK